jgi:hypothetical protein
MAITQILAVKVFGASLLAMAVPLSLKASGGNTLNLSITFGHKRAAGGLRIGC